MPPKYLDLLGEFDSINGMTERHAHHRRALENAKHDATAILECQVRKTGQSSNEAMLDEKKSSVAFDKSDRMSQEIQSLVVDLLSRIRAAREPLSKY